MEYDCAHKEKCILEKRLQEVSNNKTEIVSIRYTATYVNVTIVTAQFHDEGKRVDRKGRQLESK